MNKRYLDIYKVEKQLGKSKFGITYLAHDTNNKKVLIKHLYSPLPSYNHEILRKLNQLNIHYFPKSQYITTKNNEHLIIRDYIEGSDIKSILNKPIKYAQIPKSFFTKAFIEVFNAINLLHKNGIIHGDIKPSNILIKHPTHKNIKYWKPSNIALIDFERALLSNPPSENTYHGFSMIYSPPEQILRYPQLLNPTIDIFATCVSLLETLTNKKPLYDCNAEILINLQLTYPIPKPQKMDTTLFEIIKKGFYKEKFPLPPNRLTNNKVIEILKQGIKNRYQDASEIKDDLEKWLQNTPIKKKHWLLNLFQRIMTEK
jgi:serine/threonine protein kinase